ncbi:MAG: PIN domain-containing protein [Chloroflexota bacterium]|nr:MAG: PIN domain-containing protein [Chloroflexota bacterium]
MEEVFVDTNILLRHVLGDHPQHSPRATAFLERIERGEVEAHIADTVVFETVFTLQRQYRQPKARIRTAILPLIELPSIILPGKRRFREVFDLYVELNLSFADAYHAVLTKHLKLEKIVSFDQGLDRVKGIRRIEP